MFDLIDWSKEIIFLNDWMMLCYECFKLRPSCDDLLHNWYGNADSTIHHEGQYKREQFNSNFEQG
jgi:hypothetical protein